MATANRHISCTDYSFPQSIYENAHINETLNPKPLNPGFGVTCVGGFGEIRPRIRGAALNPLSFRKAHIIRANYRWGVWGI